MKMKTKTITTLFLAILTLCLFANSVSAGFVVISQIPYPAKAGDYITIIATIDRGGTMECVNSATMNYRVNGVFQSIKCNEKLPLVAPEELTFKLGTVSRGDFVQYKVYITFEFAGQYQSEWYEIDLTEENTQTTETTTNGTEETILAYYYSIIVFIALSSFVLINKRRKLRRAD